MGSVRRSSKIYKALQKITASVAIYHQENGRACEKQVMIIQILCPKRKHNEVHLWLTELLTYNVC